MPSKEELDLINKTMLETIANTFANWQLHQSHKANSTGTKSNYSVSIDSIMFILKNEFMYNLANPNFYVK